MSKSMLVVDDQEDLRGVLRDLLGGLGYVAIEADDGEAGVANGKSGHSDLILVDIRPVMDGYEANRHIKACSALKPIPIVAVSSFAMKGDEEKARAAGCDHYVTKPYSRMQLLKIIRGFLGDARESSDGALLGRGSST
jgi:two-component system, cell cycle response regulator DivK